MNGVALKKVLRDNFVDSGKLKSINGLSANVLTQLTVRMGGVLVPQLISRERNIV